MEKKWKNFIPLVYVFLLMGQWACKPNEQKIFSLDENYNIITSGFDLLYGSINNITVNRLYSIITRTECNSVTNFRTLFNNQYPNLTNQSNALFELYGY